MPELLVFLILFGLGWLCLLSVLGGFTYYSALSIAKRRPIALVVTLLLVVVSPNLLILHWITSWCAEYPQPALLSPTPGRFTAQLVGSDCGIGSPSIAQARLVESGWLPILGRMEVVFEYKGVPDSTNITWEGPTTIRVSYKACSHIYQQKTEWSGVSVIYEADCSSP